MNALRLFRYLTIVAACFSASSALAERQFWVAIASYTGADRAQSALSDIATRLVEPYSVLGVATDSGYFYRLAAGPYPSRERADEALTSARTAGFADAWVFSQGEDANLSSVYSYDPGDTYATSDLDAIDRSLGIDPAEYPTQYPDGEEDPLINREVPNLVDEAPADFKLNRLRRDD